MKYMITFGSDHLQNFNIRNPMKVALVIEADDENSARDKVFSYNSIGEHFCTSYEYNKDFIDKWSLIEYTLEELDTRRID